MKSFFLDEKIRSRRIEMKKTSKEKEIWTLLDISSNFPLSSNFFFF